MKLHNVEQGSAKWHALRLGIPTASEFDRIVTPGDKLSEQAGKYAYRLVAEKLLGRSLAEDLDGLKWIEHGKEYEAEAAKWYEFDQSVKTEKVGFMTDDAGEIGASPDRLVGDHGIMEIKCVAPQTMVEYFWIGEIDKKYKPQIQGQLLVSGRDWCDWLAYSREMPPVVVRTQRDEEYIGKLSDALTDFCAMKQRILDKMMSSGFWDAPPDAKQIPPYNVFA